MKRRALVLLVLGIAAAGVLRPGPPVRAGAAPAAVPQLQCEQPRRLELHRFEDGSARLYCGRRLLARVGVPW